MNYHILFCGMLTETFDTVVKLMIESARESDYLVTTATHPVFAPYSTIALEASLIGSSKKEMIDVVIDFDHVYVGPKVPLLLYPSLLDIEITDNMLHYWGMAGSLLKVITDLSPAYVTSFLLDKGLNPELALFKKHTLISLPIDIQKPFANINMS